MYCRFPEEYFFPVIMKEKTELDFIYAGYRNEEILEGLDEITILDEIYLDSKEEVEENTDSRHLEEQIDDEKILDEADEEYIESEMKIVEADDLI